ncbi:hypothetical protein ARTHRO9V_130217 [Arthrobacter sp. 9V]|uniref:hypothetical protein n=1 Tax=Arthrobacter sp. 9V TaxID=2653132 RepID=UPI0012F0CA8F|nr:hypothetical protein [Arthrobacter sp. 9V]VXB25578.1 hypothetical protein ARTHRO9V_130217 [Arthrobacter sp. 9V]
MNSDEIWLLQLWSGVFGAAISAVLAAGVAILVVTLTNKHQTTLSQKAIDEQRRLAEVALEEQKRQFELTLKRQSEEARQDRLRLAVHDAVAAADDVAIEYDKGLDAIDAILQRMRSAVFRWSTEVSDRNAVKEVMRWPHHTANLAIAAAKSLTPDGPRNTPEFERLIFSTETFISLFSAIPRQGDAETIRGMKLLAQARKHPDALAAAFEARGK